MSAVSEKGKVTGAIGISAAAVYGLALVLTIMTTDGFSMGSNRIELLFSEDYYSYGCIAAGLLLTAFGVALTVFGSGPRTFIGTVRGALVALAGVLLAVMGVTNGEHSEATWMLIAALILTAAADAAYDWVVDMKLSIAISVVFLALLAGGAYASRSTNDIGGFMLALFAVLWVVYLGLMALAPVEDRAPSKAKAGQKKGAKAQDAPKKNGPAPRPYPAKKAEPAKKEAAPKKEAPKPEEAKKEAPKAQPKIQAPKREEPAQAAPKREEAKKEPPKLKVMSSRDANAVKTHAMREKQEEPAQAAPAPEPVQEPVQEPAPEPAPEPAQAPEPIPEPIAEPVPEPAPEQIQEPEPIPEPIAEEPVPDQEAEPAQAEDEEFEIEPETPDALLRRATWNKGLRCRRDYGEHQIPIAFVKGKVAVYVTPGPVESPEDDVLRGEGWTVLRYAEGDISDGKEQADEINKAVKANIKAEAAAKKRKK
ncbi:MAG: hypothetical protein LBG62_05460 [Candidatus Methanoplasma sp.]|jgi:colicin import membrane protein|nr:hypothetical protein [Candidatus Methanoplasma sp.]